MPKESEIYIWPDVPQTREQVFPGVVIEGFGDNVRLEAFDDLLSKLAHLLVGEAYPQVSFPRLYGRKVISTIITDLARGEGQNGKLNPLQAIILPLEDDKPPVPLDIRLLLEIGVSSSGRGSVGILRHCIQLPKLQGSPDPGTFYARVQNRSGVETNRSIQAFLKDSAQTSLKVYENGLRRALHAGLPGLGKRR